MELMLFSNSTVKGRGYLEHAADVLAEYLGSARTLLFVPFAGADHEAYTALVADALRPYDVEVTGLHAAEDPLEAIERADLVFTGGGNTFRLVKELHERGLMGPLSRAVRSGTQYMGSSAGTNIAAPSLRTTNDMPIVQPPSFETLGLVPFQINPHYLDADPTSTHAGETRADRIREFHEENSLSVLGLREGTYLRVISDDGGTTSAWIGGDAVGTPAPGPAVLFRRGSGPEEVCGDVSSLFR
ncbi:MULTISPECIES: dipeptidase PepE [Arthrobacter]|uniref:Dipeptidase PepE n=1 Tax=Arthrobacter terricola TaxID=2547396 RepID=A0A4R5K7B5_9MICC|nr:MULTISPECIES: dipeptidase PepE [Arthrobacter]MBT8163291.1 dipeptidase PepE [Arthrobacter sp. GN70]TDF90983.1 dipeptidase PepE [Arthrobacter terricola]